jgi:subtilisin family serine protease
MPTTPPIYHQGSHVPDYYKVLIAYSTQGLPVAQIERWLQTEQYQPRLHVEFAIKDLQVATFEITSWQLSVAEAVAILQQQEEFSEVTFESDRRLSLAQATQPNDLLYAQLRPDGARVEWALDLIGAPAAWDCVAAVPGGPRDVLVAVIDSGVQADHQDLNADFNAGGFAAGGRLFGQNAATGTPDNTDSDGHGTMVLGTVAAVSNNTFGVAGVARCPGPTATSYLRTMAVKINDARMAPTADLAARGINLALCQGARVINLSWHVLDQDNVVWAAIKAAGNDALFVVAAGNQGEDNNRRPGTYPASCRTVRDDPTSAALPNIVSVMASNEHDQKPSFSNYGGNVHIAAPGTRIPTTGIYYAQPRYPEYSGTSAAAPHVAAAAALLLAIEATGAAPQIAWTPTLLRDHLIASADLIPELRGLCQANGRLNIHRAVCGPLIYHGPPALARGAGSQVTVEWRLRYDSPAVSTVELVVIDRATGQDVTTPTPATNVNLLNGDAQMPLTAMSNVAIRIRCCEMPNFFADSEPFNII